MNDLTTKQAAEILGLSEKSGRVRQLWRTGKLNGYKINRNCLMIKQDAKFEGMEQYYDQKSKEIKDESS